MEIIDRLLKAAKAHPRTVVLPEGDDDRILRAARRLRDEGIATPILLGPRDSIAAAAASAGVGLDDIELIDPRESDRLPVYAELYARDRGGGPGPARRLLRRPLPYGAMMVAAGDADAMVGGAASPTRRVVEAGLLTVGLAEGIAIPSSFFLMLVPGFRGREYTPLVFADCAVTIEPDAEALAAIALASADTARRLLGEEPRVAMLSFSTLGSAHHARTEKIAAALAIARAKAPDLAIDGELQADTALIPEIATRKIRGESSVAGRANVLVFPDLDAGNIGYKLLQHLGGATAIGPVLQGFAKPIADLSRGADVDDIVAAVCIALAQC